jgi:hypothetical protein
MTTPERSYGNFRRAEEASNAQGISQVAVDWAFANAEKNPTQENKNIAKDIAAAQMQMRTEQGKSPAQTSAQLSTKLKAIVEGMPAQSAELDKIIAESKEAIAGVNIASEEARALDPDTKMEDAYQRLYDEFNALGLGALVSDAKDLLMKSTSIAAMPDALRGTKAYMDRFSANDARIKAGLRALSPAEYLDKEDAYQNIMRNYGLPAAYYKTGLYGKQEGFDKLLAGDVSAVELEDRIFTAQNRVLKANPEVSAALKQFYPDITNGDILAYTLDPTKGLEEIKRKVTAAEIGGAAMIPKNAAGQQILTTSKARAEQLASYGVDKEQATQGYSAIGSGLQRGSELASIYGQDPYTQTTAEEEIFKLSGQTEAEKKRRKITGLEKATFGGQTGLTAGALARDRAGGY